MKLRKEVRWFAGKMEAKLRANDHKGGWLNIYVEMFLIRLEDEYDELIQALECGDPQSAINECVDLANFAMMLADNLYRYGIISNGQLTRTVMDRLVSVINADENGNAD